MTDLNKIIEDGIRQADGSSDYRNDRNRPYDGQPWTDSGIRGKTKVKGLTMRDLKDCLIKGMLMSAHSDRYLNEEWSKCWDFSSGEGRPTEFLLAHQNEPDFISVKAELNTWLSEDVYKIDFTKVDPLAICQNFGCEIEKMMGIYPNIPNPQEQTD